MDFKLHPSIHLSDFGAATLTNANFDPPADFKISMPASIDGQRDFLVSENAEPPEYQADLDAQLESADLRQPEHRLQAAQAGRVRRLWDQYHWVLFDLMGWVPPFVAGCFILFVFDEHFRESTRGMFCYTLILNSIATAACTAVLNRYQMHPRYQRLSLLVSIWVCTMCGGVLNKTATVGR